MLNTVQTTLTTVFLSKEVRHGGMSSQQLPCQTLRYSVVARSSIQTIISRSDIEPSSCDGFNLFFGLTDRKSIRVLSVEGSCGILDFRASATVHLLIFKSHGRPFSPVLIPIVLSMQFPLEYLSKYVLKVSTSSRQRYCSLVDKDELSSFPTREQDYPDK